MQTVDRTCYEEREAVLRYLSFKSYTQYLRSDLWKSIRKRFMVGKCRVCCVRMANTLHHTSYDLETMQHGSQSLVPLCRPCHILLEFTGFNEKNNLEVANARLKRILRMKPKMRKKYIKDKKQQMRDFPKPSK